MRIVVRNRARCVAALAIVNPNVSSLVQDFLKVLSDSVDAVKTAEGGHGGVDAEDPRVTKLRRQVELALLCLGEIGKYMELGRVEGLLLRWGSLLLRFNERDEKF